MLWELTTYFMEKGSKTYEVRFAVITIMHFIDDEHIDEIWKRANKLLNDKYYVQMAVAWFYQKAAIKFPTRALSELQKGYADGVIDKFTHNKALQKMIESRLFSTQQKGEFKKMKVC